MGSCCAKNSSRRPHGQIAHNDEDSHMIEHPLDHNNMEDLSSGPQDSDDEEIIYMERIHDREIRKKLSTISERTEPSAFASPMIMAKQRNSAGHRLGLGSLLLTETHDSAKSITSKFFITDNAPSLNASGSVRSGQNLAAGGVVPLTKTESALDKDCQIVADYLSVNVGTTSSSTNHQTPRLLESSVGVASVFKSAVEIEELEGDGVTMKKFCEKIIALDYRTIKMMLDSEILLSTLDAQAQVIELFIYQGDLMPIFAKATDLGYTRNPTLDLSYLVLQTREIRMLRMFRENSVIDPCEINKCLPIELIMFLEYLLHPELSEFFKEFREMGVDFDRIDTKESIRRAIMSNNVPLLEHVEKHSNYALGKEINSNGSTLMHKACKFGHVDMILYLKRKGLSLYLKNAKERMPVDLLFMHYFYLQAGVFCKYVVPALALDIQYYLRYYAKHLLESLENPVNRRAFIPRRGSDGEGKYKKVPPSEDFIDDVRRACNHRVNIVKLVFVAKTSKHVSLVGKLDLILLKQLSGYPQEEIFVLTKRVPEMSVSNKVKPTVEDFT